MSGSYKKPTLPASVNSDWGKPGISKGWLYPNYGSRDSTRIYVWALVDDCSLEDCPLYDECPYKDTIERSNNRRKCTVQSRYLKIVFRTAVGKVGNMMDDDVMLMIGLELVPLYNQLLHLKVQDKRIGGALYKDKDGNFKTNPTYREMRDVMKEIRKIWKEIEKVAKKGREVKDVDAIGDNSFIEALSGDDNEESDVDDGEYDPSNVDPAIYDPSPQESVNDESDGEGIEFPDLDEKVDKRKRAARTRKKRTKAQKEKAARRTRKAIGNKSNTYVPPYSNKGYKNDHPRRSDGTFMTREEIEQNLNEVEYGSEEN